MRQRQILAGLAVALLGCGEEDLLPEACAGDVQCPPPSSRLAWAADLWPGATTVQRPGGKVPLVSQEEPALLFAADGSTTLRFSAAALLQGGVFDDKGQAVGRARVVAVLPSRIPGQSPKSFETSTDPTGTFTLRLPVPRQPNEQPYKLWVGFDDALAVDRPPLWRRGVIIRGDTQLSLQAKKVAELALVHGRIVDLFGNGVGGMRIQVLDSRREVVSSTGISREEPGAGEPVGAFGLYFDPSLSTDGMLQIVASPGTQGAELPILSRTLPRQDVGSAQWVDLRLPAYRKPRSFTIIVRGTGTSGATTPVAGARLRAQVLLESGGQSATYVASGDTDSLGQVTLPLVPATTANLEYTVTVQSPAGSPHSSDVVALQVGKDEGFVSLWLPLRTQLSGKLVATDGGAVSGAQIVARNISEEGQAVSLVGRAFLEAVTPQTMTGSDGRFALRLDQGDYDLDLLPPAGVQPRSTLANQRVLTDDIELGIVHLPPPTLGRMLVVGPDGYAVSGAIVRVFQLPDTTPRVGFACAELLPCSRQASLRAEVTTDTRGRAQFLLPDASSGR